jgi:threonylcarbamoyladenosine tRNA methylthiotransferase MtaB
MLDNYYNTLEHEIFFSVYYYNNKINNIDLHTIGCELSEWDGERIVEIIKNDTKEDVIVVNTCAVTEQSQLASEKVVEKLHYIYPNKKMYITGCGVNYNPDYYKNYGICLPNESKFDCNEYNSNNIIDNGFRHNIQTDLFLIKIQDGCHNKCSYCAINLLRKHPYSIKYDDIKLQVKRAIQENRKHICLIGTEICTYNDGGLRVSKLCEQILHEFPEIEDISMGALDPASPEVFEIIDLIKREPKMNKTIYLSTQSGSDTILKLMNRRHTVKRLEDIVKYAEGKVFFCWHIIAGFPGETEELWKETIDTLYKLKPIGVDVMPFSAREGTPAYNMVNNNDEDTINRRVKECYKALDNCCSNFVCPVDIESLDKKEYETLCSRNNYYPINIFKDNFFTLDSLNKDNVTEHLNIITDLYDIDNVKKIFEILGDNNKKYDNLTFIMNYDINGDDDDLEVNLKLLVFNYGVKIVSNIELTDMLIDNVLSNKFNLRDYIVYKNTYIRFIPSKTQQTYKKLNIFLKKLDEEKIYHKEYIMWDIFGIQI